MHLQALDVQETCAGLERIMRILETERLYLRELRVDDKKALMRVLSDPESMQFYPHPFSEEEVANWIQWNIDNYKSYQHGLWAVILKEGEVFLGDCGITMQSIDGETVPEIGFHIINDYCNQGYATEAALACKEYAFNVLHYPRIFSYTTIRNIPSQKVAEKIGLTLYKYFEKNGERQIAQIAIQEKETFMNNQTIFDSEYCHVEYMESDHAILLAWKKFARLDDYRKPTLFALDLMRQFPHSSFIIDARNGFEDDKADVEWGFSELLPNMAKTTCKYVILIMQQITDIEYEMDMWTKELQKYFAVSKAESYEQAIHKINTRLLVNVTYTIKPDKRDEFLDKVKEQQIIRDSKAEPGNFKYEYYIPVDSLNTLFLMEIWACSEAQLLHGQTEHYAKLQNLKKEYVTDVAIEKYEIR